MPVNANISQESQELTAPLVKLYAKHAGFDLCGITTPEIIPHAQARLSEWLANGYHGEMSYMARNVERRANPSLSLTDAKSVIVLALNYFSPDSPLPANHHGRIAKYARGRDYHLVMDKSMRRMVRAMVADFPALHPRRDFKCMVDHGPLLERAYAEKAGLGYIGKNSMLITREFGSWVLLATIITTAILEPDIPNARRHGKCGTCRRCIDACPTRAIVADGVIDATRCISYLTIEKRGEIDPSLAADMGDRVFGCDICQDVCPHNGRAAYTSHDEFKPVSGVGEFLDIVRMATLEDETEFRALASGTPLTRPKLSGLRRNAEIVLSNLSKGKSP